MKKWILGAAIFTCLSFGLAAQQHKNFRQLNSTERAEKMTDRMAEELKLTAEQKKQVSQLVLENANRQEELLKSRKAEFEAQRVYRKEQEQKMASILTEEQKKVWEERKEAMRNRMGPHSRGDHPRGGRPRFRRGR
jgi:Spy/CpxP family protein refolding chaperone